jgi:RNA polymerase sigma-70 factor (ECF subfamily)
LTDNSPNIDFPLLQALANDDEQAFKALYQKYHQKLFYFIFNFTRSQEAAEDAIQEVFVKVWSERKNLAAISNFNAWIFRIARNHVFNGLKRMAHETLILTEIAKSMQGEQEDVYSLLNYKDIHAVLKAGMNELPPQQQLVMQLSREEGLKYEEIGQRLKISPLTVKKHAAQALQYLREKIRQHYSLPGSIIPFIVLVQKFF